MVKQGRERGREISKFTWRKKSRTVIKGKEDKFVYR
jgi:hypothetical protein